MISLEVLPDLRRESWIFLSLNTYLRFYFLFVILLVHNSLILNTISFSHKYIILFYLDPHESQYPSTLVITHTHIYIYIHVVCSNNFLLSFLFIFWWSCRPANQRTNLFSVLFWCAATCPVKVIDLCWTHTVGGSFLGSPWCWYEQWPKRKFGSKFYWPKHLSKRFCNKSSVRVDDRTQHKGGSLDTPSLTAGLVCFIFSLWFNLAYSFVLFLKNFHDKKSERVKRGVL